MGDTLSIVPSDGSNDFPVLKAFQEYIDAEQAKARKRMLGLSVFFIILLLVVVVTFVLVLTTVVNRNQALSDRLLDYALRERSQAAAAPQPAAAQPAITPTAVQDMMKPVIERFEREQASMKAAYERQSQEAKALADARDRERLAEIEKARKELQRERAQAKKEADAQAAKERHLRRLYPDYYERQDEDLLPSPDYRPKTQTTARQPQARRDRTPPAADTARRVAPQSQGSALSDLKPITYFDSGDDGEVPFILETPAKKAQ